MPTTTVSSGHTSTGLTVSSGSTLLVDAGGSATNIAVNFGGLETVFGAANATALAGSMTVSLGGTATATTVTNGGVQTVSSGGTSVETVVSSGGTEIVLGQAAQVVNVAATTSVGTTISLGAGTYEVMYVGSGFDGLAIYDGWDSGAVQEYTEQLAINLGAASNPQTAAAYAIDSGAFISSYPTPAAALLAYQIALAEGTLGENPNHYVWGAGGSYPVSVTMIEFTLASGGDVTFWAPDATLGNGGQNGYNDDTSGMSLLVQQVSGGGVTSGSIVSSGGSEIVSAGGLASGTTVDPSGSLTVSAGGSAVNTVVNNGGTVVALGSGHGNVTGQVINIDGTKAAGTTVALAAGTYTVTYVGSGFENAIYDAFAHAGGPNNPRDYIDALTITVGGTSVTYNDVAGGKQVNFTTAAEALSGYEAALANGTLIAGTGTDPTTGAAVNTITFTLAAAGNVTFAAADTGFTDNAGGISILVTPTATPSVGEGTTTGTMLSSGGIETVSSGGIASHTTVSVGANQYVLVGGSAVDTVVLSGGNETVSSGGETILTSVFFGGAQTVSNGGTAIDTILLGSGATQTVQSGGTTSNTSVGSGGLEQVQTGGTASNTTIDSYGTLNLGAGAMTSGSINFSGTSGTLVVSAFTVPKTPISNFVTGDTIDLLSLPFSSGGTDVVNGGSLTVTQGGTTDTLILPGDNGTTVSVTSDGHGGTELVAITCFRPGTMIATPDGEVAVETLRAGDLVLTADGSAHPVRWLGVQTVSRRFADPLRVLPIRITAGALGENLPVRDLLVSPSHAVLVDGVLVQAGALVNGRSIVRVTDMPEVFQYFHIELDSHALLIAEGLPAESYLDTVETGAFDNAAERPAGAVPVAMDLPRVKSARQLPAALRWLLPAQAA